MMPVPFGVSKWRMDNVLQGVEDNQITNADDNCVMEPSEDLPDTTLDDDVPDKTSPTLQQHAEAKHTPDSQCICGL